MFNTQYFKQKKFYRGYLFRECKSSPRYLVSFKTLFTDYTLGLDVHSPVECFIRSSHPEVFSKKGVLRNFTNSEENTCASVFFQ